MPRPLALAVLVAVASAGAARAESLEDLIKEYCAPTTPGATRAQIQERLGRAGPSRTRQPFKRAAPGCDPTTLAHLLVVLEHPDTLDLTLPRLGRALGGHARRVDDGPLRVEDAGRHHVAGGAERHRHHDAGDDDEDQAERLHAPKVQAPG